MKEFESLNGELTPHVREILDFLRRRNEGKHGRYLEGKRSELASAIAEVAQSVASPPAATPAAHDRATHAEPSANGNGSADSDH
jgi:hypothetical protein